MSRKLFGFLSRDMAIDLGTANTLVYVAGKGIVLNEPSVVAIATKNGKKHVLAVGEEAKMMVGRTPGNISAIRPMKDGVIADFNITQEMIRHFIAKVHNRKSFAAPRIVICVPSGATPVERRAIQEAAESAGGRDVYLIEEPMAAAIGAGLPVTEPTGSMIVDIGGGTTEVAIISLGGIVNATSVRVGGDKMDDAITQYIRRTQNLLIGEATAEKIKKTIGSAIETKESASIKMVIKGRSLISGIPSEIEITQAQIVESLADVVRAIADGVKASLETTAPELTSDIYERGITMTGGGSLLQNLDRVIQEKTGVPVYVSDNALQCVVLGTGKALEEMATMHSVLMDNAA